MEAYIVEWLNLLGRWIHVITGVAWIGASFYFIWLDNHLLSPKDATDAAKGVGGEVWSVHGGGFYHAQKYKVSPPALPDTLHWFKWEAYSTWLSGMFLLALIYWYGASVYLVDPSVANLAPWQAVAAGAGSLVVGWLVYDGLCRSPLGRNDALLGVVLFLLVVLLAWGLCRVFSGRGAYIHYGAVLGTIMVANVYFVIIPGQKAMVAAAERGEMPDPAHGLRGKQRSVHNTYFTLPVLFVMTSNHFAFTYASEFNWLILVAITVAGALIRVWFVARHRGSAPVWPLVAAVVVLLAIAGALMPARSVVGRPANAAVATAELRPLIDMRCVACHSAHPTHPAFPAAPAGVQFDTDAEVEAAADRIHQQVVVTKAMPIGNLTGMTDDERALVQAWYDGQEDGQ